MGLIVGVRPGTTFYVGDTPVKVIAFTENLNAVIKVADQEFVIYDDKATEVLPRVFISMGKPSEQAMQSAKERLAGNKPIPLEDISEMIARIVIEAPRDIPILREKLYGRSKGQAGVSNPSADISKGSGPRGKS